MVVPVAVVLGVGSGLGAAVAYQFARQGYAVALMARNLDHLTPVEQEIKQFGETAISVTVDATDIIQVAEAFAEVQAELGTPEVLIYNAGMLQIGGILELTPEQFEQSWKVNCFGAFLAAQQVLPAMVEQAKGTIIFTGATAAIRGSARFSALAVGKFGLRALAQSLAREFGTQGVHVAHVMIDGLIDTPRVREMFPQREPDTLILPDAIAKTYWQLHQQSATGWTLEMDIRPSVEKF
ncbi:SDR family NAD(P)-dependent oxidoreductase [Lyngbya sp. PCC 8106]|uniref:SDR family NAD(P)-dependent oxidoreductase n=1 Tax=Lyngbya sp. (strain PCC 8106) TaxID=313612 RepID=UPI0000EAA915|nr:SDR family NAD(P)-dependent oxidoreductase [Lyngbya sp. PCC 8106]EAW37491.1 Short-chain dehydrogenase/reductase SDR [Lyngbya sp. PCC 8106]